MQLLTLLLVLSNMFVVAKEREELSKLAVKFQSFFYNFSRVEVLKYYTFRKYNFVYSVGVTAISVRFSF